MGYYGLLPLIFKFSVGGFNLTLSLCNTVNHIVLNMISFEFESLWGKKQTTKKQKQKSKPHLGH